MTRISQSFRAGEHSLPPLTEVTSRETRKVAVVRSSVAPRNATTGFDLCGSSVTALTLSCRFSWSGRPIFTSITAWYSPAGGPCDGTVTVRVGPVLGVAVGVVVGVIGTPALEFVEVPLDVGVGVGTGVVVAAVV